MSDAKKLASLLRNVGPKLAEKMLASGIDSPEKLRQLGAKRAYSLMYKDGDPYGDHNAAYMYALEGAIQDCDWSALPESIKQEYREFAQAMQSEKRDQHN